VALVALIDEATGYQYERAEDTLEFKLRLFLERLPSPTNCGGSLGAHQLEWVNQSPAQILGQAGNGAGLRIPRSRRCRMAEGTQPQTAKRPEPSPMAKQSGWAKEAGRAHMDGHRTCQSVPVHARGDRLHAAHSGIRQRGRKPDIILPDEAERYRTPPGRAWRLPVLGPFGASGRLVFFGGPARLGHVLWL
jgi:hypothetical protein